MTHIQLFTLTAVLLNATAFASMSKPADNMAGHDMSGDQNKSTMSKSYQVYSKAAFDAAKDKQRVLFFHATWCPTCKGADADLMKNLAKLPSNVVVFKTDYDKEVALKKKYGITSQHTFVLVDTQGMAVKKWSGGATKEILAATKKM